MCSGTLYRQLHLRNNKPDGEVRAHYLCTHKLAGYTPKLWIFYHKISSLICCNFVSIYVPTTILERLVHVPNSWTECFKCMSINVIQDTVRSASAAPSSRFLQSAPSYWCSAPLPKWSAGSGSARRHDQIHQTPAIVDRPIHRHRGLMSSCSAGCPSSSRRSSECSRKAEHIRTTNWLRRPAARDDG